MKQSILSWNRGAVGYRVPKSAAKKIENVEPVPRNVIDYFHTRAFFPPIQGSPTRARRILEIGERPYYWKANLVSRTEVPSDFWDWAGRQGLLQCNSVLVNVYDEKSSYIGWHIDQTRNLANGTVVSFSFALREEDEGKVLAEMEFSSGTPTLSLRDKTRVEFDAFQHKEEKIQHRVRRTLLPRINITFRHLK